MPGICLPERDDECALAKDWLIRQDEAEQARRAENDDMNAAFAALVLKVTAARWIA